jgi:exodeoxyribonuclease V gamma subunit
MGYEMFTGPRLERLVEAHLPLFDAGFFGARPLIVLQNQSLAQWLKLFLARAKGGYATGDFVFQDELLRRLIAGARPDDQGDRVLFIDDLKFELYRHLSRGADPALAAVLRGGGDPGRLFELADHLAGLFHNYAMNSALWPAALTAGVLPAGTGADPETFAWQAALWRELLLSQTLAGLELERLTRDPPQVKGEPRRVVIVGSAFLSRRAAAFLSAWAEHGLIDVVHLLLLPSALPPDGWPAKRPWSSWGAFGRAFLEALPAPGANERPEGATTLARLQNSLAAGQPFEGRPDGTVEVVSAPHALRELEALRDRLLGALAADPTLEVSDIAVLAPDINVYAPFLDAAFSSDEPGRRLNFHVIDLDLGRENAWFRALDALLALISGNVDRPSLFALVDAAPFREAWKLEDEERALWLEYTETVSAWREVPPNTSSPGEPQSWSGSWHRLFEGWFRGDPDALVPPLTAPPSAFQTLGRFHALLEQLKTLAADARRPRKFIDWVQFLDKASGALLIDDDAGSALSGRLRTLADAGTDFELPWAGFRAFVQDQIAHFPGRRGQLLTEGLHCSSLQPLRAIPFRVVAVLGLDEGAFPRRDAAPSFDLSRYEDGHDALSVPARDRYCFWETVMAARDLLYLSYQGRSAVDGTPRPASSVLSDLLDHLETSDGNTSVPWPVAEISVKDFSAVGGTTWSPRSVRRAEAAWQSRTASPKPFPLPPLPEDEDPFAEVTGDDVVRAFTVPARFHLERVRQVYLRDEDTRGVDDEEPWSLSFLDKHAWLAENVERELGGLSAADTGALVERAVALGQAREGVFADRDRRELATRSQQASEWARALHDEGWRPAAEPSRTRWAGRPWSGHEGWERDGTLLVPLLLYGQDLPARNRFAAALDVVQRGASGALLSTMNPSGERRDRAWNRDLDTTALARTAEDYWNEAAARPLPFYPDLLERVARRLDDGLSLTEALPAAWDEALDTRFGSSRQTFGRCPYARLVFAGEPDWPTITADLERWWEPLFLPLLGAWT